MQYEPLEMQFPPGSMWRNRKTGGTYMVRRGLLWWEPTWTLAVRYTSTEHPSQLDVARPVDVFLEKFERIS
jgi:hypothetical protein